MDRIRVTDVCYRAAGPEDNAAGLLGFVGFKINGSLVMAFSFFSTPPSDVRSVQSIVRCDRDRPHKSFRLRSNQIDRQQAVFQIGAEHLHAVCQHESALELTRRYAAVKEMPALVLDLAAADDELIFLNRDIELVEGKSRDRKRDPQPFRVALIARQGLFCAHFQALGHARSASRRD